ncbi:hypothetical protein KM043_004123 [Ampulex compressa]|nr:hypothetical protein KM043_004123 [Ampulex compressa]
MNDHRIDPLESSAALPDPFHPGAIFEAASGGEKSRSSSDVVRSLDEKRPSDSIRRPTDLEARLFSSRSTRRRGEAALAAPGLPGRTWLRISGGAPRRCFLGDRKDVGPGRECTIGGDRMRSTDPDVGSARRRSAVSV